jgi:Spy/CpxP family protein refolding chaperone
MKTQFRFISRAALVTILIVGATVTAAEPPDAPRRPDNPPIDGRRVQRPMPGQFQGGGGMPPVESILDQEQRMKFSEEMRSNRERMRELNEKSAQLRRELNEALFGDRLDEELVRKRTAEISQLESERSLIRARAFAKVRPSLTEQQLEQLKTLRSEVGRGNRPAEDGFRPPRPFRPPEGRENEDVLPPPRPSGPPK